MKITFDIECTPEEARSFLGLPDVKPMQEALMAQLQDRMASTLAAANPEALLKAWLPAGVQGIDQLQKMFWGGLQTAGFRAKSDE